MTLTTSRAGRLPRALHPMAWWVWALGLATAASRTTNPLLLLMILAVAGYVVAARRTQAPWARAFHYYLTLGLVVIAIRIVFRSLLGTDDDPSAHVLLRLPEIPLPHWAAGVQLGGPVTLEGTLAAAYDGLRLATLLCCIGAANALANPKRALRVLPGALYELGMAVVVSVTVAPQLIESAQRVRRARRLRGGGRDGLRMIHTVGLPVLQDALDRCLYLAAAMDSRGYGRRGDISARARRGTAMLLIGGLMALCVAVYSLLDGSSSAALSWPALAIGVALCSAGLALGGRRVRVSTYRPDPWRAPEWTVAGCGVASAIILVLAGNYDAANLNPSLSPLAWPSLPLVPLLGILLGAAAAVAAPPVPTSGTGPVAVIPREPAGATA